MRETKTKVIGNFEYSVVQLGATQGRKILTRMAKLVGGAAGAQEPLSGLVSALNDDDVSFLCDTFSQVTTVKLSDRQSPYLNTIFEEHFAGKYLDMMKWLGFCLEVNFGSFLVELGINVDTVTQTAAKRLNSLKDVNGASGG